MFSKIAIIGSGNVGYWLYHVLTQKLAPQTVIEPVPARDLSRLTPDADLYIFAVKDDFYEEVLQNVPFRMPMAAHTSGSLPQEILAPHTQNYGVFYPFQTISKALLEQQNFPEVPLCIEGNNEHTTQQLLSLAHTVSDAVYPMNSEQRQQLHLAAVFASNFSNALFNMAKKILGGSGIPFEILYPLIDQTVAKIKVMCPADAQTGPAQREDHSIMQKHVAQLDEEQLKKIYQLMSEYIIEQKKKKE